MDEQWDERAIFLAALELHPVDREPFLRGACPDSEKLSRIEDLLRHSTAPSPGRPVMIREFRIIRELGRGGMGVVYLARDEILGRQVALKVLAEQYSAAPGVVERFNREAVMAAGLNSPRIVQVYQFGEFAGTHFITMEYVEGRTLTSWLDYARSRLSNDGASAASKRGEGEGTRGLPPADRPAYIRAVAVLVSQVADALELAHAHSPPVTHRDVKPSNILLDNAGEAKLADFGIAKIACDGPETTAGQTPGTPHYMSPEQAIAAAAPIDHRTDIFSLGVVLYEALALRRPFEGETAHQVLRALIDDEAPALRSVDRRIPVDLATICHKAIEKHPRDRYQSAAQLRVDLQCWLRGDPILARPRPRVQHLLRAAGKRRTELAVAGLIAAVLIFALWLMVSWYNERTRVVVDLSGNECVVLLTQLGDDGLPLAPPEPVSVRSHWLTKGTYRFTVVRETDGAFSEFDLYLGEEVATRGVTLRVLGASQRWPGPAGEHELLGLLRTAADAAETMLTVGSGTYLLDGPDGDDPNLPETATLGAFLVDSREVSNEDYLAFVEATGSPAPYYFDRFVKHDEFDAIADLPVTWITKEQAAAFARWRGKRLPTLPEWQAAARGQAGALYPRGAASPPKPGDTGIRDISGLPFLNRLTSGEPSSDRQRFLDYLRNTRPVDRPADWDQVGGLLHMHSNVREYTSTVNRDELIAGRSWEDPITTWTLRNYVFGRPGFGSPTHGFRCAKSVDPASP